MIARYSTPEMTTLWSEARRYQVWLDVELAATRAWETLGEVPAGTTERLRQKAAAAPLDDAFAERVAELEAQTRHDIVAFTRALSNPDFQPLCRKARAVSARMHFRPLQDGKTQLPEASHRGPGWAICLSRHGRGFIEMELIKVLLRKSATLLRGNGSTSKVKFKE